MDTVLTDDEISSLWNYVDLPWEEVDPLRYARAIEAAVLAKLREQEPVAWMVKDTDGRTFIFRETKPTVSAGETRSPLYAAPQPAAVQVPPRYKLVPVEALTRWRAAFAEELAAYDIDPPIHHILTSHDEIDAMLATAPAAPAQPSVPAPWREAVKVAREALIDAKTFVGAWPAGTAALAQLDRLEDRE